MYALTRPAVAVALAFALAVAIAFSVAPDVAFAVAPDGAFAVAFSVLQLPLFLPLLLGTPRL
jgi:hypothetical protein